MNWVNIKERLPDESARVIIRWFWEDGNSGVCWKDLAWIKQQQKYYNGHCVIEWLDEAGIETLLNSEQSAQVSDTTEAK